MAKACSPGRESGCLIYFIGAGEMNTNATIVKPGKKPFIEKYNPVLLDTHSSEELSTLPESLWQSPSGSFYRCINDEFVCVYVHSASFRGWINKTAIRNIRQQDNVYLADQAFRDPVTGTLSSWEQITLDISESKIIKHFPVELLKFSLVNGLREVYTRVYEH